MVPVESVVHASAWEGGAICIDYTVQGMDGLWFVVCVQ